MKDTGTSRAHSPTARSILARAVLTLIAILGAGLLLELAMALTGSYDPHPPLYPGDVEPGRDATVDPEIGWHLPPNVVSREETVDYMATYRANSLGFRDREPTDAPGARRIAFLGDSYTFGSGVRVDETFVRLIERRHPGLRTDNFAIGGFGLDQMWRTLRRYALDVAPDVVVLCFIHYDLDRSLTAYRRGHIWLAKPTFRLAGDRLRPLEAADRPQGLAGLVERHSRLRELVRRATFGLERHLPIGYRWRLNRALFAAVRDDCAAAGVPLVVVHIPVNRAAPAPAFAREMEKLGIPYLDLQPLLPADRDSLYYPTDRHFTPAGHRFAADAIDSFLQDRGLLERPSVGR